MAKTSSDDRTPDDLSAEIATLRADLERLTERLVESGGAQAHRFAEDLRSAGERALAAAGERVERGREHGEDQVAAARTLVRDHPLTAVACAAGVGFLLARLARRD
jgi:ElaB/YqjD/DUF883 family membrane-anchored ribosome-binding protein